MLCFKLAFVFPIFNQNIQAYSWAHHNELESTADAYFRQAYFMNSVVASDAFADWNSMHSSMHALMPIIPVVQMIYQNVHKLFLL